MKTEDKKAAIAAYKERKNLGGIYKVTCVITGRTWVGGSPDLTMIWNRISFGLRLGTSPNRSLQAAWSQHGADQFAYRELERIEDEKLGIARTRVLRERAAHWAGKLGAELM